jgi:hypothetical protein
MVDNDEKIWLQFMKKHWKMFGLCILIAILAFIDAIYVFLWFVGEAQSIGLVPKLLSFWAMGHFLPFILHLIFWEFIYVGIPLIIAFAAIYFLWWKKLPDIERKEYREGHLFGKRSSRSDASGGFSFLIFIFFCIKVYLDGNWGVAISTWTLDYLVNSCVIAIFWIAIIFGIPILIGGTLWIRYEMKKKS